MSHTPELFALRARYVFPVTQEPISDGVVTIESQRIAAVGRNTAAAVVEDLGNVALVPGLANAHVHLELSELAAPLGEPGMSLADWIARVIGFRRGCSYRPERAVEIGLRESVAMGTTTLAEIAQPEWPRSLFDAAAADCTVFLELIAPTPDRVGRASVLAEKHLELGACSKTWAAGLCPHAPYSVHPRLLRRAVELSHSRRAPLAFHLAESQEEIELLAEAGGPLRDLLRRLDAWDPEVFPGGRRPLDYLRELALAHRTLVIHGNYLTDVEIAFLAEHSERMAVVYCPRTHAYFGYPAYPLAKFLSAGATVALGTDSRASSPDLSVLAEMRFLARRHQSIAPDVVLKLGTLSGARALGRQQELGSFEPGKYADLAAIALPDRDAADPHELLFDSDLPVVGTWRRGLTRDEL